MRKIKFYFKSGMSKTEDTIEVEDDTTDSEIDEMLSDWLWGNSDANWHELEKDE